MSSSVTPFTYSLRFDATKLLDVLIKDLDVPSEVADLKENLTFHDGEPYLPVPHKSQAASAALHALLAIASTRLLALRGIVPPNITIDTYHASIFLFSAFVGTLDGHDFLSKEFTRMTSGVNDTEERTILGSETMNVYKTKDARFFHLHGSLIPSIVLKVLDIDPNQMVKDVIHARQILSDRCSTFTAKELRDIFAKRGLVGDILLTPEEYDSTEQGKIMASLPLTQFLSIDEDNRIPVDSLPKLVSPSSKPLEGVRVVELTRVIAGSVAGRLLSEMGATVVRVIGPHLPDLSFVQPDYNLNKRPVHIDLRTEDGKKSLDHLLLTADVFMQGYRPNALGRLGYSHERLSAIARSRGKPFVIIDESCYGGELSPWNAPWALRSGYQQIADSITGVAYEVGRACGLDEPVIPCLPISDYLTGILCAAMTVLGLVRLHSPPSSPEAPDAKNSIVASISLSSMDLWLRRQEKYPPGWVRNIYETGPQFGYQTGFTSMLLQTMAHANKIPNANREEFYRTVPAIGFTPNGTLRAGDFVDDSKPWPKFKHLAPVIKFEGIDTEYNYTSPWGYWRVGWDEEDADVLEAKRKSQA